MPLKRVILEMGAGNDLHGGDYTKAAIRAVEDAVEGGLDIPDEETGDIAVIASAAVAVRLDLP
jgi:uncharacterized protein (TIGR02058 family)